MSLISSHIMVGPSQVQRAEGQQDTLIVDVFERRQQYRDYLYKSYTVI